MVEPPADEGDERLVLAREVASEEDVVHAVERREGFRSLRVASALGEILDLGNLLAEVVGDLVVEANDEQLAKRERRDGSRHYEQDEVRRDESRASRPEAERPLAAARLRFDHPADRRSRALNATGRKRVGRLRVFGRGRSLARGVHIGGGRVPTGFHDTPIQRTYKVRFEW